MSTASRIVELLRRLSATGSFAAEMAFYFALSLVPILGLSAAAAVVKKATELRQEGRQATILFSLSGHGLFDLAGYEAYLDGTLPDQGDPSEAIASALRALPEVRP
jgi:predicted alternative tryptophan synthase beta-subunit